MVISRRNQINLHAPNLLKKNSLTYYNGMN